ncbi:MAG: HAD family hydrolase [Treponema sp.]|jgi:putative hydrolase of the HAD superfamily|nr:HAD family hydrolase [Treponema sp.]
MEKQIILFIDSGDTLIDEGTEVRDDEGVVIKADLIAGAGEALRLIHDEGYTIALVADGNTPSFDNVYAQHRLRYCFDAWVISETVGFQKPAPQMFRTAMDQLMLSDTDKNRIVMVGNNLRRDIPGANRFGIVSVWLDWSPRYPRESRGEDEIPDYVIHSPCELPSLLQNLEEAVNRGEALKKTGFSADQIQKVQLQ